MKRISAWLLFLLTLTGVPALRAQMGPSPVPRKVWQLSGMVVHKETREAIPYARIQINHSRRMAVCNGEGFYSVPVFSTDTLYFYSLGFTPSYMVMQDYVNDYQGDTNSVYLYSINYLREDSITLATVTIHPYNTPWELRTAMLEEGVPGSLEEMYARQNLDPRELDNLMKTMPKDEGERMLTARQMYYNQYQGAHVAPTVGVFNPVAVYQLLRYINEQTKKKKVENLNDWLDN